MKDIKGKSPESLGSKSPSSPVDLTFQSLIKAGAEPVHQEFSITTPSQYDLVLDGKRMLVLADSTVSPEYGASADLSLWSAPQPSAQCKPDNIVVNLYELPRDGRTLLQVAVSSGDERISNSTVYGRFGAAIQELTEATQAIPDPKTFDLQNVFYLRMDNVFMLNPATQFVPATTEAREEFEGALYGQLVPKYNNHGASEMMDSFLGAKN